jgi:hypothetical protein
MAVILLLGVFPKPFLEKIDPAVRQATACVIDSNRGAQGGRGVHLAPICFSTITLTERPVEGTAGRP